METISVISFIDVSEKDEGFVLIGAERNLVKIVLGLRHNGDMDVFLNLDDSEKVLTALQTAIAVAKAE